MRSSHKHQVLDGPQETNVVPHDSLSMDPESPCGGSQGIRLDTEKPFAENSNEVQEHFVVCAVGIIIIIMLLFLPATRCVGTMPLEIKNHVVTATNPPWP